MPSRRPHKNSHHGCDQCKTRRLKCDEEQPCCLRCRRNSRSCSYRHLLTAYNPFVHESGVSKNRKLVHTAHNQLHCLTESFKPSKLVFVNPASRIPQEPAYGNFEIRLLQYYDEVLSGSIPAVSSSEIPKSNMWDLAIKRYVVSHDYLRHSVMTFSCLHLAVHDSSSRKSHITRALEHQNAALSRFRIALNAINADNCGAALTCSVLLLTCAFAFPVAADPEDPQPHDPIKQLTQILYLFTGVISLYSAGWQSSLENKISPFIRQRVMATGDMADAPRSSAEDVLDIFLSEVIAKLENKPEKEMYYYTASGLRKDYKRISAAPGTYSLTVAFARTATKEYIAALDKREPIALILLAHWAVCLHHTGTSWWMKNWGIRTVKAVSTALDDSWSPYLSYPRQEVGLLPPATDISEKKPLKRTSQST